MSPDALATLLLHSLRSRSLDQTRPRVLGISGLQGSGKSTLAARLVDRGQDLGAVTLSLDDFYLTQAERQNLAQRIHPLLATRGVPGTHDLNLLGATLEALANASADRPARIPRFDKSCDERVAFENWPSVTRPPRLIVLEAWCLGLPPQADAALQEPVNMLEREEDADGRWRQYINAQLTGPYTQLWQQIDDRVLLQAPAFEVVMAWRGEQERDISQRHASRPMDADALRRFIAHYERLSRHSLAVLPARADIVIALDRSRAVREICWRNRVTA